MMETKICSKCGIKQPFDQFYFRDGKPIARCKDCVSDAGKDYYKRNRQTLINKRREYRLAHVDAIKIAKKLDYEENHEARLQRAKRYYWENRATRLDKWREHYVQNVDKMRERQRRWARDHPDYVRHYAEYYYNTPNGRASIDQSNLKRRSAIYGVESENLADLYQEIRACVEVTCYLCGNKLPGKDCHIDHITPLSKKGKHVAGNIAPTCPICNLKKKDKIIDADMIARARRFGGDWNKNKRLSEWV